jgi:hypothetical protein
VIALDASAGMLETLGEDAAANAIDNVQAVLGRWPPDDATLDLAAALGPFPCADVSFIAHVGYDIEAILPFLEAMEAAARRLSVAVLMDAQPGSVAAPLWPAVHGEARIVLPGMNELLELLRLRGCDPVLERVPRETRTFESREALTGLVRRQLWVAEGSEADARLLSELEPLIVEEAGGYRLGVEDQATVGVVTWRVDPA